MNLRAIILALIGLGSSALLDLQGYAQEKGYSIKEGAPAIGTNIRKDIVFGSDIPFDRRYSDLTPEQKQLFKRRWESMAVDDEPPFPIDGLGSLYRKLAAAQQRVLVDGPLDLDVEVDTQGNGRSVRVLRSPSAEVTKLAAAILMFEKYKPAVCNGQPCLMWLPIRVDLETHR